MDNNPVEYAVEPEDGEHFTQEFDRFYTAEEIGAFGSVHLYLAEKR
jgi:hypothetical protein